MRLQGKYYSLVLVDPDAPSSKNPINKHWIHWGVMNIPGRYFIHGAFDPNDCDLYEEFVGGYINSYFRFTLYTIQDIRSY